MIHLSVVVKKWLRFMNLSDLEGKETRSYPVLWTPLGALSIIIPNFFRLTRSAVHVTTRLSSLITRLWSLFTR